MSIFAPYILNLCANYFVFVFEEKEVKFSKLPNSVERFKERKKGMDDVNVLFHCKMWIKDWWPSIREKEEKSKIRSSKA
jgi:hypothetical protein